MLGRGWGLAALDVFACILLALRNRIALVAKADGAVFGAVVARRIERLLIRGLRALGDGGVAAWTRSTCVAEIREDAIVVGRACVAEAVFDRRVRVAGNDAQSQECEKRFHFPAGLHVLTIRVIEAMLSAIRARAVDTRLENEVRRDARTWAAGRYSRARVVVAARAGFVACAYECRARPRREAFFDRLVRAKAHGFVARHGQERADAIARGGSDFGAAIRAHSTWKTQAVAQTPVAHDDVIADSARGRGERAQVISVRARPRRDDGRLARVAFVRAIRGQARAELVTAIVFAFETRHAFEFGKAWIAKATTRAVRASAVLRERAFGVVRPARGDGLDHRRPPLELRGEMIRYAHSEGIERSLAVAFFAK